MKRILASVLLAAAVPAHAETLHQRTLTLDTHLDTPMHFARQGWSFGDKHSYDTDLVQVDMGRMDEGDLDGGFFVIYTEQGPVTPEGFAKAKAFALGRADLIRTTLAKVPDRIALISTAADAKRMDAAGKRFGWLSIENSYPLGEDLSLLKTFYDLGVRLAGPVHSKNNQFADSATDTPQWNGLSPLGRQWVAEMAATRRMPPSIRCWRCRRRRSFCRTRVRRRSRISPAILMTRAFASLPKRAA